MQNLSLRSITILHKDWKKQEKLYLYLKWFQENQSQVWCCVVLHVFNSSSGARGGVGGGEPEDKACRDRGGWSSNCEETLPQKTNKQKNKSKT